MIFAEISPLHHATVKSYCYIMHRGVKSYHCKMQRGVKGKIRGNISPLHNAAVRFHSLLHDAAESLILPPLDVAGSQFGNG